MKEILRAFTLSLALAAATACSPKKMNTESYIELTKHLGHELPKDFINFLQKEKNEEIEEVFYWVVEDDWGSGIDYFYPLESEDETTLLEALREDYPPQKEGMMPIATDGSFGYILMSFKENEIGSIYFMSQETDGASEVLDGWGYWKIADSFSDFLDSLEEPPEDEL